VAANFSSQVANMKLVLPEHAFEWMQIPVTDDMHPGYVIDVAVPPMDAKVIRLI
jgi:hypothetical protein